jgi:NADH/NAD ratio-sensing transcriptional regulator Rex
MSEDFSIFGHLSCTRYDYTVERIQKKITYPFTSLESKYDVSIVEMGTF